ncbi:beta-glucanase [Bacillus sp. FJAT-49682]|uniref:Beta-glucanase n=2 Tax=Lederbergia citrea TaxID=2833581 RepID=A0A942UU12_9BACI|nr:beta-glucanase [Lederbergia citrea]
MEMRASKRIKRKLKHPISFLLMLLIVVSSFSNITLANSTNKEDAEMSKNTPKRPFPQHVTYTEGTIKPNHVTQEEMDATVARLYDEWKERYLKQNPYDKDQYYIFYNHNGESTNDPREAITVSEAHGYGMVITALMAGHDPDAKKYFDGLYRYFRAHPSEINPQLMAWQQAIINDEIVDVNGVDSALDGDMDIAYSLLLADKQWGSDGEIDYLKQGKLVIDAIMESEIHQTDYYLKLADWASDDDDYYGIATRPSDFMLQHLQAFKMASGDTRWDKVIDKTYNIINDVFAEYSPNTGLLPDFLLKDKDSGKFKPADPWFLESSRDGDYYWNSSRVPWRITSDYLVTGDDRAKAQLSKLNSWIRQITGNNPANIKRGYKLDGTQISNNAGDAAFSAPFTVSAMMDDVNQQWLNDLWDYNVSKETAKGAYFANNIRMLSMIIVSGNWWSPTEVSLDYLNNLLENYITTGDVNGPLTNQLTNSLKQAEHQYVKGHQKQATKSMEDFIKHISNKALQKHITPDAKRVLIENAGALIQLWTD